MPVRQFNFKKFSPKQLKIFNWWLDPELKDKSAFIGDGSVRSGKTLCMSVSYILWSMTTFDGENFGFAGQSVGALRRNVMSTLLEVLDGWAGFTYRDHRAENYVEVNAFGHTNYYYIFGGKDESSYKTVQGFTAAGFFFDEVALQPESFVNLCLTRISRDDGKKWFNCNPAGSFHWFKTQFLDHLEQRNAYHLHFTLDDNPALGEKTKQELRNQFTGVFYQRYILGKWVQTDGLVFDNFNADKMVVDTPEAYDIDKYVVSCDYGIGNPTVFLLWGHGRNDNVWYLMREYYHDGRHHRLSITGMKDRANVPSKVDADYVQDLNAFLGPIEAPIIVDPSAKSFIVALRQHGYRTINGDNDVIPGIRVTQQCMNQGMIKFCRDLPQLFREFGSYAWDPKAAEHGEDKVIKKHDHICDSFRYFCMCVLRPTIKDNDGGIQLFQDY